jgi:dienelactone hydrolase
MRTAALVLAALVACTAAASAENVTIPAQGSIPAITGELARPSGAGPFPAVLVLHGCGGFGDLESQTVHALQQQGYVALAIDTLAPQNLKNACGAGAAPIVAGITYAYAALAWLAQQPGVVPDHLGVLGFSMGAIEVLGLVDPRTPHPPPPGLRAAVAYYPECLRRAPDVAVPLLILDGDADDWNPAPPCRQLASDATAAGKSVQIQTYPGATHAFNEDKPQRTYLGHLLRYDASATQDAAAKTAAFFAANLR